MKLKSINPFTGKILSEFEEFSDTEINKRLRASEEAFKSWRKTSFGKRKSILLKVADLLNEDDEVLAQIITDEMGKTKKESVAEVKKCAWVCEHYANDAALLLQKEAVATDAHEAYITYEPLGPILGVMPWNFPFWQVFRFIAPTLMAGNTVLLKHASNVQLSAQAIEDLFLRAGLPEGVMQNLVIGSKKVQSIIEDKAVKAVTLTGSEFAGQQVAAAAGENIKKTVLELGGSNAFIVLDDADIEKAVEIGLKARIQNAGQSCIAAKRFILHKSISDEFINHFRRKMSELNVGDPNNPKTDFGPLSSREQAETVKRQVEESVKLGARIIMGGYPKGALYPPTLVTHVKPGMPLFDEEVFGPVAPIIICETAEQAVELSNNSSFGLGVSLFTNDLERAETLIPQFEDGAVFVNALVKSDPRLPFGGTKRSGYGRELAGQGIREFVNVKTIYIDKFHDQVKKTDKKKAVISMG